MSEKIGINENLNIDVVNNIMLNISALMNGDNSNQFNDDRLQRLELCFCNLSF